MQGQDIGENHHVLRYCKPSSIGEDGLPLSTAFELRDREDYLSVNWLEFFETQYLSQAVNSVREAFKKKNFNVKSKGGFISLRVDQIIEVIQHNSHLPARIIHLPSKNDPSHSGIYGIPPSHETISSQIAELAHIENMHQAIVS